MTKALCLASAIVAVASHASAGGADACGPTANAKGKGPAFCAIPTAPTDVRSPAAFKAAVVDVRLAGRELKEESGPNTFGLPAGEAESFSRSGREAVAGAAAAPPPSDTDAFASDARREAIAPAKPRRPVPQPQ